MKTKLLCEASFKFQELKMWKRSFRARLPWNSKSWRRENGAFMRGVLQIPRGQEVNASLQCSSSTAQSVSTHAKHNSTASTKKTKESHLEPSVPLSARIEPNSTAKRGSPHPSRKRANFSLQRLREKNIMFWTNPTVKPHPYAMFQWNLLYSTIPVRECSLLGSPLLYLYANLLSSALLYALLYSTLPLPRLLPLLCSALHYHDLYLYSSFTLLDSSLLYLYIDFCLYSALPRPLPLLCSTLRYSTLLYSFLPYLSATPLFSTLPLLCSTPLYSNATLLESS